MKARKGCGCREKRIKYGEGWERGITNEIEVDYKGKMEFCYTFSAGNGLE